MLGTPAAEGGACTDSSCASLRPKPPLAERSRHRWGSVCYGQAATSRPVPLGVLTGLGHAQNHVWSKGPGLLQVMGMRAHRVRGAGALSWSPHSHPSPFSPPQAVHKVLWPRW